MKTPARQISTGNTPTTRGFSLVELLIVLAILAMIVGLSWPALQKPWRRSRLQSAAKQLQSELGRARVEAIESSRVLQFRYQPNTRRFFVRPGMVIATASDSALDSTVPDDSGQQYLDAMEIEESLIEQLPDGVFFRDIEAEGKLGLPLGEPPHERDNERDNSEENLQDIDAGQLPWSKPITFYPNGRVTGGRFRLAGLHGYQVDVTLRGLTGTAKIGKVLRQERLASSAPKNSSDKSGGP